MLILHLQEALYHQPGVTPGLYVSADICQPFFFTLGYEAQPSYVFHLRH